MSKFSWFILLAFLGAVASVCATAARYQLQVNGYTENTAIAPFIPGASFSVLDDQEAKNPLLEKEIKAKLEKLLTKYGYPLVPYDKADYYLKFSYGMGAPQAVSVTSPSVGFGIGFGSGCWGWGPYGAYGLYWPGYSPYYTETQTLFNRWLVITVVEGKPYRESGKSRTVWVGDVRSIGTSSDFREVVNSLLIAAFEQFGKNTGKAVSADVSQNDPRYQELERVR